MINYLFIRYPCVWIRGWVLIKPLRNYPTRNLGLCIKICQLNIEGISRSKCDVLQRVLSHNDIDIVAIQETHAENEKQLDKRGKISGYDLVGGHTITPTVWQLTWGPILKMLICAQPLLTTIYMRWLFKSENWPYITYTSPQQPHGQHKSYRYCNIPLCT